ncbi:MAG: hypothetical protein JKY56_12140 [Kofleriaceae bacterium]|nr:hypothetical protein [Kofleriaceae bacterium]
MTTALKPGNPATSLHSRVHLHRHKFGVALALVCAAAATACSSPNEPNPSELVDAAPTQTTDAGEVVLPSEVTVQLMPQTGVSGTQLVNFAIPLSPGTLSEASNVEVLVGDSPATAYRRGLANYPDGSLRSVQIQVEVDVDTTSEIVVAIGTEATGGTRELVDIVQTLLDPSGETGPMVWTVLPPEWLSKAQLAGPSIPHSAFTGSDLDAWTSVCDYDKWNTEAFLAVNGTRGPWLYDRVTTMFRGYQVYGGQSPLSSAFREAHLYRNGMMGTGTKTRIGVPNAASDVKYHYAQGLALHYLLTGDDRFREAAENVALRMSELWPSPGYAGGADFWIERHAGFSLLAYVWAAAVSDDRSGEFESLADEAITAYFDVQATYPIGYNDTEARCFAHSADAHGEGYGYIGCSPWMSAILTDALDAYVNLRSGTLADTARTSLVQLGRAVARDGIDDQGKPYYWMGVDVATNEVDSYDEHWGEPAYVIALAYHHDGRQDAELLAAAKGLVSGLATSGTSPHVRSFNWQCRSAVMAPYYLAP